MIRERDTYAKAYRILLYILIALPLVFVHHFVARDQTLTLLVCYGIAFLPYLLLARQEGNQELVKQAIAAAILIRLVLIPGLPMLSDDAYRFVWDSRLQLNGINPFAFTPLEVVEQNYFGAPNKGINKELFNLLNSKEYFTIYPPIAQLSFLLTGWVSSGNMHIQLQLLQLLYWALDATALWLLPSVLTFFGIPGNRAILFALNPMVLLELSGNIHMEAPMIALMVIATWLYTKQRFFLSAVFLGLALGFKFNILLLFPILIPVMGWKRGLLFGGISFTVFLAGFIVYIHPDLAQNLLSSTRLYFDTFEFNASIYYLYKLGGTNSHAIKTILQQSLPLVSIVLILFTSFSPRIPLKYRPVIAYTIYIVLSTTVHPWYLALLLLLGLLTPLRYVWVWSFAVIFSYSAYATPAYTENLWLVCLSYLVVILAAWFDTRSVYHAHQ